MKKVTPFVMEKYKPYRISYLMEKVIRIPAVKTFPIVKSNDEAKFGTYRTKEQIIEFIIK